MGSFGPLHFDLQALEDPTQAPGLLVRELVVGSQSSDFLNGVRQNTLRFRRPGLGDLQPPNHWKTADSPLQIL